MIATRTHFEIAVIENGRRTGMPLPPSDFLNEAVERAESIAAARNLSVFELSPTRRISDLGEEFSGVVVETVSTRTEPGKQPYRVFEAPRKAPSYPFTETRLP